MAKRIFFEYNVSAGVNILRVRVLKKAEAEGKSDLNALPFGVTGEINFKKQIKGDAAELLSLGKLSKRAGGVLLAGCVSDNYGVKRRSVFAFENGKLTAICDMNADEDGFSCSRGYKTLAVRGEKIGVLVDKDIFSPNAVFALCACGCSAIIDLFAGFLNRKAKIAAEFYAYCYGVNFVLIAPDETCVFNSFGDGTEVSASGIICLPELKKCRETRVKKRGVNF